MALADSNEDGTYSEEELNTLTKAELLVVANELGVEGVSSKTTKADIVTAILNR